MNNNNNNNNNNNRILFAKPKTKVEIGYDLLVSLSGSCVMRLLYLRLYIRV
jgi:hypothetical protein